VLVVVLRWGDVTLVEGVFVAAAGAAIDAGKLDRFAGAVLPVERGRPLGGFGDVILGFYQGHIRLDADERRFPYGILPRSRPSAERTDPGRNPQSLTKA
jgi:hypothetical protein